MYVYRGRGREKVCGWGGVEVRQREGLKGCG